MAAAAIWLSRGEPRQVSGRAHVADGDTLRFETVRVRLIGIDAPEFDQQCGAGANRTPCGRLAREHLRRLIGSGPVTCEGDGNDRYGRLLATCAAGGVNLNRAMVRDGWAVASGDYLAEEDEARRARRGIWADTFDSPRQWRRDHPRGDEVATGGLAGNMIGWFEEALTRTVSWFRSLFRAKPQDAGGGQDEEA